MNLILGASGRVGSRVAARLLESGEPVRAVSRSPERLQSLAEGGAETVRGDLLETGWLPDALRGVRHVVASVHGLVPPSRRNHPGAVDGQGVRRVIDAAAEAGVDRFVLVSAAGAGEGGTAFLREKLATEKHLGESGLSHAIIRPTVFMETHALFLMGSPLRRGERVTLFGRGETPLNWISVDDVAVDVVRALEDPPGEGTVRVIGGPDVLSRVQVLEILEEALGRKARRRHVPLAVVRLMRALLGPFHPGMRYLLDMVLAEEVNETTLPTDPDRFDWVSSTGVREVVARWAEDDGSKDT